MKQVFAIILSCLVIQGALADQPSPWKPIGKIVTFVERTMGHVLSPNGKQAAWSSAPDDHDYNQDIILYDVSTGHGRRIKPKRARSDDWQDVQSLRYSDDSSQLAVAIQLPDRFAGRVDIYDVATSKRIRTVRYKKHSDVLHTSEIISFRGNHLEISDEFEGTYVLSVGKAQRYLNGRYRDTLEHARDRRGTWVAWTAPEFDTEIFSPSVLNVGTTASGKLSRLYQLKTGSTIDDLKILPDQTSVISCETGGPVREGNLTIVNGGGAVYCRDLANNGKILYKITSTDGMLGTAQLSTDGRILLLIDRNFGEVSLKFYRR